jgi:hypothetical protein
MKLIWLNESDGLQNLNLLEEDQPEPKKGEELVRIRACH